MQVKDLTTEELKALIRETVTETLQELLGNLTDPQQFNEALRRSLELQKHRKQRDISD